MKSLQGQQEAQGGGTHVVPRGVVLGARLDAVGQEAEDGPDPQEDGEAPEELAAELDPLGGGGWRCECVRPIPGQDLLGFAVGQTLGGHRTRTESSLTALAPPHSTSAPGPGPARPTRQARAPARSRCCTSGRLLPPTSCALSEEEAEEAGERRGRGWVRGRPGTRCGAWGLTMATSFLRSSRSRRSLVALLFLGEPLSSFLSCEMATR